ncbi:MAG: glycosyltransferase family 4 protein [Candidatus Latescibacterota bacterium]
MKVVHVPRRFVRQEWGGTETVILETSRVLLRRGHGSRVVCAAALASAPREVLQGVPVERLPYFYPYWGLSARAREQLDRKGGNLFSFALLRRLQRPGDADIIHLHTGKRVGGIVRHAAHRLRIPYVVSVHGGALDVPAGEALSWTEPTRGSLEWGKALGWWVGSRRVWEDAAAILCVGRREQEMMQERHPGQRVIHLPNGVDVRRFAAGTGDSFRQRHGMGPQDRVILTVGRIDAQKNQLFLVRALPRLLRQEARTRLLLVGHVTGEEYCSRVQQEARALGVAERVTLIRGLDPASQELVEAYHAADLFALPSVHEPFGIVILEAWAAGLPVIASNVGGVPSFVEDGKDGLLFPPGDEEAFLGHVCRIWREPRAAARLGSLGRIKAEERFSWDHVTDRLLEIYEEAIHAHPVRQ